MPTSWLGGNEIKVIFFVRPTNLHAVWDVGLLEHTTLTIPTTAIEVNRDDTPRQR